MDKQDKLVQLLLDDTFSAWVLSDGKDNADYWQKWMKDHPEQASILERARITLLCLKEEKYQMPEERKDALRQKLIRLIQNEEVLATDTTKKLHKDKQVKKAWFRIAAAAIFLAIGCLMYIYVNDRAKEIQYSTAYGEIKTIVLPDSSKVTLNGNSSISYAYQQAEGSPREVWLEGEGFFEVKQMAYPSNHGGKHVKFIVYTDNLSIKVLGTRFNVKHRHQKTQVVLAKGSVELNIEERDAALLMQPDELVEVMKGEKLINQKVVKADDYIAWKEGVINFEGATIEEIRSILNDNYGFELQFTNPEHAEHINLRGAFPTQNIDILLEAIANVTHTSMKKKGKTIIYQ